MSKSKHISQEALDAVDSPELTGDELAKLKPAREVLQSALFEKLTKGRGSQKTPTKEAISLRLDSDVIEHFRATGSGWQTRINRALRETVKEYTRTVASDNKQLSRSASSGVYVTRATGAKSERTVVKGSDRFPPKAEASSGRWTSDNKRTAKPRSKK